MCDVDTNSRKIMLELFRDGRTSNTAIAKKLGLSVLTVAKKINTMTKNGAITIKAIPNPVKMGNHACAFIGLNVDLRKVESICTELKNIPNILFMVTTFGRFDLLLIAFFHDYIELEYFAKIKLKNIDEIKAISTFMVSEIKMGSILFNNVLTEDNEPGLDAIDRKLILELMENGRPLYSDLATKLGISKATISRRILSLLNENIITIGAIPNVNLEYLANAFILINIDLSKFDDICKNLLNYSETHLVIRLMNYYDMLLSLQTSNREELYKFITHELVNIDGIFKCETFILANFLHFNADAMCRHPAIMEHK